MINAQNAISYWFLFGEERECIVQIVRTKSVYDFAKKILNELNKNYPYYPNEIQNKLLNR